MRICAFVTFASSAVAPSGANAHRTPHDDSDGGNSLTNGFFLRSIEMKPENVFSDER